MAVLTKIPQEGFPWMLFASLDGDEGVQKVLAQCPRSRDDFSEYWLSEFPDAPALSSQESTVALSGLASVVRDNTLRVEKLHGQFQREMTEKKNLHVTPTGFSDVSSLFFMQRHRGVTHEHWSSTAAAAAAAPTRASSSAASRRKEVRPARAARWKAWVKLILQKCPRRGFGPRQFKGLGKIYREEKQRAESVLHTPGFKASVEARVVAAQNKIVALVPQRGKKRPRESTCIESVFADAPAQRRRCSGGKYWRGALIRPISKKLALQRGADAVADNRSLQQLQVWSAAQRLPFGLSVCGTQVAVPNQHGSKHFHVVLSTAASVAETVCKAEPRASVARARVRGGEERSPAGTQALEAHVAPLRARGLRRFRKGGIHSSRQV